MELAAWITSSDNPLTARVAVNRVWQHLFGQGLVRTVDNFGFQGEPPSHPELLDYLASRFRDEGWSLKQLIRYLVLSRSYRQSTRFSAEHFEVDPDNQLVWRGNRRRLDVEALRDALLQASGKLKLERPEASPVAEIGDGEVGRNINTQPLQREFPYRSVYLPILRSALPEMLKTFDFAEPSIVVGERAATTIPAQALFFMNSQFVLDQARGAARRVLEQATGDSERIGLAYQLCLARSPVAAEQQRSREFLQACRTAVAERDPSEDGGDGELEHWTSFCQALFATGEFRYLD